MSAPDPQFEMYLTGFVALIAIMCTALMLYVLTM